MSNDLCWSTMSVFSGAPCQYSVEHHDGGGICPVIHSGSISTLSCHSTVHCHFINCCPYHGAPLHTIVICHHYHDASLYTVRHMLPLSSNILCHYQDVPLYTTWDHHMVSTVHCVHMFHHIDNE